MDSMMLEVENLSVFYGVIPAVRELSFSVDEGEIIALIGANGAGKTTTLHTITGLIPARMGHVMFHGTDLTKVPAHKIVEMGMAHVPEGRRIFQELTVLENLQLGAYTRKNTKEIEETLKKVYAGFPGWKRENPRLQGPCQGESNRCWP